METEYKEFKTTQIYIDHLIKLSEDLEKTSRTYFEFQEGNPRRSMRRSDAEIMFISKIAQIVGYISALKK